MNIPCDGDGRSLCALWGPPKPIEIPVREKGSTKVKWLSLSTDRARPLGFDLNHFLESKAS